MQCTLVTMANSEHCQGIIMCVLGFTMSWLGTMHRWSQLCTKQTERHSLFGFLLNGIIIINECVGAGECLRLSSPTESGAAVALSCSATVMMIVLPFNAQMSLIFLSAYKQLPNRIAVLSVPWRKQFQGQITEQGKILRMIYKLLCICVEPQFPLHHGLLLNKPQKQTRK